MSKKCFQLVNAFHTRTEYLETDLRNLMSYTQRQAWIIEQNIKFLFYFFFT